MHKNKTMQQARQHYIVGFFLSLTAAGLWGILPIALKELLTEMDAGTVVWFRFVVAGAVLGVWLTVNNDLPPVLKVPLWKRFLLVVATIGLCGNYYYFSLSLNYVNAETSEAVIQLTTLFLILGGVIVYKEPFVGVQKIGTLLIVLGLLLFFHDRLGSFVSLESAESIGVLIVVVSAVSWTVYALLQKRLLHDFSSTHILFFIYLVSAAVSLPFTMPSLLFQLSNFQLWLLVFCCANTVIAYGSFAEALKLWDASKVSATLALAPLFTIGGLKIIVFFNPDYAFSDRLSLLSICGAFLLIIGSVLTALMPGINQRRAARSDHDETTRFNAN